MWCRHPLPAASATRLPEVACSGPKRIRFVKADMESVRQFSWQRFCRFAVANVLKLGTGRQRWHKVCWLAIQMVAKVFTMRMTFCLFWLMAVGTGFALILKYQNVGGSVGVPPEHWPVGTQITLDSQRDTLVMFAHPQCPCTRASMEELNRLLARCRGQAAAHVFFFKPEIFSNDWTRTDLWRSASSIPGVTVHEDSDGKQARLFGAETSGYVLLYDTHGQLLFKGGITGSRGHAGDNAGENAIVSLLAGEKASLKQTPVYGCSLLGKCEAPAEGVAK